MFTWLARYHASLLRAGATAPSATHYANVQRLAVPWFLALLGMIFGTLIADAVSGPSQRVRATIGLLLGLPIFIGMTHALGTYLFGAIRSDLRGKRSRSQRT